MSTDELLQLKGLQFVHHNVRSLFHKIDTVRNNFVVSTMDVICFSETWLNGDIPDELINLESFSILRNDRSYGRGGGHVFISGTDLNLMQILIHLVIVWWKYKGFI